MKVKSILAALLLMVTGLQTVWAQKVLIYKADKTTIELGALDVDSIVFVEKEAKLVSKIELSETSLSLQMGSTKTLTATVLPYDADNKTVTWKSSDKDVATVSNEGLVTAVAKGTCIITCSATDDSGVKATCEVNVTKGGNIEEVTETGLPVSTMISPDTQWAANIMVFNDPERYTSSGDGAAGQIIGTPPSDTYGNEWYDLDYEFTNGQKSWSVGYSPFLSEKLIENMQWTTWPNSTQWSADKDVADIYLRRAFTVDQELPDKIFLSCCHDDGAEWYLNGVLIHSVEGYIWDYGYDKEQIYLTPEQRALIYTDGRKNVLAMHVHNYGGPALADGGLYNGEIEKGLPTSTMVSPKIQWAADMMVFKDTEKWGTDANSQVIDTPPSDTYGNEWYDLDYELTDGQKSWSVGYSPFLSEKPVENVQWTTWPNSTQWSANKEVADIYLRRTFTVDQELSDKIFLSCCHDDNAEWYLNGVLLYSTEGWIWNYGYDKEQVYLTPEQCALIHTDGRKNVLAIHVHNFDGPALADGGLYNSETEKGLPTSTMVSPKIQWAADMMVFNDPYDYLPDDADQVIGTPLSDTNGNEWYALNYELTNGQKSWSVGYSPFLSEKLVEDMQWITWPNSTQWSADKEVADIYLRRTFTVNRELSDNIYLSCCYDDGTEWYLNGVLIHSADKWSYDINEKVYLTPEQRALIHTDGRKNVLAIHTHNIGGAALADGGLYEEDCFDDGNHEGIIGTLDYDR